MKFDYKGNVDKSTSINDFVTVLINVSDYKLWQYMGLTVEIDTTVDFVNENVLVRWFDINEGFNDKIIVNSLIEFNNNFKPIL
jgi:hypothetical protein